MRAGNVGRPIGLLYNNTGRSYAVELGMPENRGGGRTPAPPIFGIFLRTA
jgi:hypothetical protein